MSTSTTFEYNPAQVFSGYEAFYYAFPDQSDFKYFMKFGKNAQGETVWQVRDPDSPSGFGDLTNKQWFDKRYIISSDGKTLSPNLPPGYRDINGYSSNAKWTISGSGLNEALTFTDSDPYRGYAKASTPLIGVGSLPDTASGQDQLNYVLAFSNLAQSIDQKVKSYTVTDSGIVGDIAATVGKLGPLAPIALSFAMPGVGSAIAGALGLGSAAVGAAIGNALLATALNGGDLAAGLKAGLASYAGASLGGLAGELAKGGEFGEFLTANPNLLSNAVNNVTQTAIKGGDVKAALAGAMLTAGVDAATSKIDGFKDLPASVQSTIKSGISQSLEGKDINVAGLISGAALNGVVSYGLSQIPGYDDLDQKYKTLAATSLTTALKGGDLTKNAINWALNQANQAVAKGIADDKAVAEGWKDSTQKADAEKAGVTTPEEYKTYQQNEADKADGWDSTAEKVEAEKEGFKDADSYHKNEEDKADGWTGTDEKNKASDAGFDDPTEYHQDLEDKADGWTGTQEKLDAEKVGATTPADWKEYKADKSAEELGWADREEKEAAEALNIHTPADYKYHLDDEAAKKDGWDNLIEKQKAEAENVSSPSEWKELLDDRDAQSKGWLDSEERDYAYTLNLKTPDAYKYYVDDQDAKGAGWDGIDEKRLAEKENITNPGEWKELVDDRDAQSKGWADREERDAAKELSIFTPEAYKYHLDDEAAKSEGWTGVDAKNDAAKENITDQATWTEFLADRDAIANGWIDREEQDAARNVGIDKPDQYKTYVLETTAKAEGWESYKDKLDAIEKAFDNPETWHQYQRDEKSKSLGFDNEADQKAAEEAGFKNSKDWDNHLDEQRIIEFFNDHAGRDPTPEELTRFHNLFGDSPNADKFSDDQITNLVTGSIETHDYVYGPDGTRYENEQDAVDHGVYNYTDNWKGPVYGADGVKYDTPEDAIANGQFEFSGVKPANYVEPTDTTDHGTQGEVVQVGKVIGADGTIYDSSADALAAGEFNFKPYTGEDTQPVDQTQPKDTQPEDNQPQPYSGPVWGPDGTEYENAEAAMAEGVFDYFDTPPEERPEEPPVEPPPTEETPPEEPPPKEPPPETCEPGFHDDGTGLCVPDEESDTQDEGIDCGVGFHLNEDGVCESDDVPEAPIQCEPGFHDDGTGLCVPDEETDTQDQGVDCGVGFHLNADGVCESDDIPEEPVQCEPGFHDDGTGLCVPDEDQPAEPDCGEGFHLNADGVCESDDVTDGTTGGSTSGGTSGGATSTRTRILQGLAKKAMAAPSFQKQVAPSAAASPLETAAAAAKTVPFTQLGGTSIYPTRFKSVLQDYLQGIQAPQELTDLGEGWQAPAPSDVLTQPSTFEQYREPDMATSSYFNYGQTPDLTELVKMQQEQDAPLGQSVNMQFAEGGMVAPLLMAKGGTGHGVNAHGALSIVQHSGKHRIDYRQGDAVTGAGDGQSDDIPAMLADGEFVIPADVVAALGNGSTKAGSDKLYEMMHSIRKHHRAAKPKDLPPPAKKSPLDYVTKRK